MPAERQPLNRLEILSALKISNWEAVTSTAHFTLTSGAFQTGFALWLGANNFWMGVIGAIPTLAGLIQIASSYAVERRGERKLFTAWFSFLSRFIWLPILLIPIVVPPGGRLATLVTLILISSLLLSFPVPAFMSWMSDLVPADHRGRYFGRRNMLAGITVIVISLPAAWFLDLATKGHVMPQTVGFGVLFGVAVACGFGSFLLLLRQAEPPMQRSSETVPAGLTGILSFYRAPLADRGFRRLLTFSGLFATAQFFAAPFYTVYALEVLRLDYVWLQVLSTAASLASLASMPLWGYLSDKFGSKPLLGISVFGTGVLPLLWVVSSREHPVATIIILILNNALGGLFWAGVGLTQFNLLIATTPSERKSVYIGAVSAITAITGGLAPILGGIVVTALQPVHARVLGWSIGSYQFVFVLNSLLRYLALLTLGRVAEPGTASARDVLTQIGASQVGAFLSIRRLQSARTESERRRAVEALGAGRIALAVEELIAALDDSSLHVREQAAASLGEIGDRRAVEALIDRLGDPAAGIVTECAEALGRIGDETAVCALARLLKAGENEDRVAAARALGRIRSSQAVPALCEALKISAAGGAPDVAEAAAAGLGAIGDPSSAPVLVAALDSAPRTLRLSIVRALGEVGDRGAVQPLLSLLREEQDAAVITHAAVALAMLDAEGATTPMLEALSRVESAVARKQVIHAVGTLIGVGDELYGVLGTDGFARDEAVRRLVRESARRAHGTTAADFGGRRRARQLERVLELYLSGDTSEAVQVLARMARDREASGPGTDVLRWAESTAGARALTAEEFLLALFAFNGTESASGSDG